MPTVARINVTPVKSLALMHPDEVALGRTGVPEDRLFYLVDERGRLFSAHEFGPLQTVRPTYDASTEHLSLLFPDGKVIEGNATGIAEGLITDFYGRPVRAHVIEGPWHEALSAFADTPIRLARCDQEGEGTDVYHVTMASLASVAEVAKRGGHDGQLDPRRFRMTFDLEGCSPHEEDTWAGRPIRMGKARLRVYGQVPRCRVTTQDPETGFKDFHTLKAITSYRPLMSGEGRGIPFGMYAEVERPGRVRVGDSVEPLG